VCCSFRPSALQLQENQARKPSAQPRLNHVRIGIPISRDGAYRRLQEHLKDGWKLTSVIMKRDLSFLTVLSKATPNPTTRPNWMGIDVNSSKIAVSIISKSRVLKQAYCGQDVSTRQFRFEERRAQLQKHRDNGSRGRAGLKLKKLGGKQRSYVRTRMWQIANEIVQLAKTFNANIAMERLRHFRKRRGEWSKNSIWKLNRIPYGFFGHALKHVAEAEAVIVKELSQISRRKHALNAATSAGTTGEATTTLNALNAATRRIEIE